jgi:pyridoxal phosphate enzyme (YggS family)
VTPSAPLDRVEEIKGSLSRVQARIEAARLSAGRADAVELMVVTKTFPASDVDILAGLGVTDVGENRDQEARAKRPACQPGAQLPRWHMIGQVQRNKAPSVVRWADIVESVDRPALAVALGRAAEREGRRIDVLIQVDLDPAPRPDRGGVAPAEAEALADAIAELPALTLRGVMGVAPHPAEAGGPRASFARLRTVAERLRQGHPGAVIMSAGMSGDLEEAISEGATQVRIGGAVLGHRPAVQ